jgi:uncharacterized protein (DUF1684 family)
MQDALGVFTAWVYADRTADLYRASRFVDVTVKSERGLVTLDHVSDSP